MWGSVIDDYTNFRTGSDDDLGLSFTLASDAANGKVFNVGGFEPNLYGKYPSDSRGDHLGTMLSAEVSSRYGEQGLPDDAPLV